MLHMISTRLRPGHLSIRVWDGSRRNEEIVKNLELRLWIQLLLSLLKVHFEIFYSLLTAPQTVTNIYAQVAKAQSCTNHVQPISCSSHTTCHVPHDTRTAQLWHLLILSFILLAKMMKEGRKQEKTPDDKLQRSRDKAPLSPVRSNQWQKSQYSSGYPLKYLVW